MKSDEGFSELLDKTILIQYQYENVIGFNLENTLKHTLKKLNPREKIPEVFLLVSGRLFYEIKIQIF